MSEARDGRGSTPRGRGPRSAHTRGPREATGEPPAEHAGARRQLGSARRPEPLATIDGARSEVRATEALWRQDAFIDDEVTLRTAQPRALLDDAQSRSHDDDTRVVHVSKILADADRALDALSTEISVVGPLPTAPLATPACEPCADEAPRDPAAFPAEHLSSASAPHVWPLPDAPFARGGRASAPVVASAHAGPAQRLAQPVSTPELPAAPSLPAPPRTVRALLLPAAIAIGAAWVIARITQSAPAAPPHGEPLALAHVVTVENRGPSAEPPRAQTLLEAFQHGGAAAAHEPAALHLVDAARRAVAEGRPGDAHALATQAVQRDAFSPHAFAALAEAELALGAPERALEAALAAAKLRPKRVRYRHLLARVYETLGRTEDAREAERLAELLAPSDPDVRAMQRAAERAAQR